MSVRGAEAISATHIAEQSSESPLRLAAVDGVVLEAAAVTPAELARQRFDRFKGRIAIEALQAEYNAVTRFAELVDGQMFTGLELTFDGHDLYGPDGSSLTKTGEKGLQTAKEAAKKNGDVWFEVGRRSDEQDEIKDAIEMVKKFFSSGVLSDEANTMLLTTDFPWELLYATEDVGGYNVTRKQALARWITVRSNGKISLCSQTLDGSNRQGLEAIHTSFGFQAQEGRLLGQRRFLNLSDEEQDALRGRVVDTYDTEMAAQFGGEWYAGRQPIDYRNTYEFVSRQRDLIELYKELEKNGELTDSMAYDLAAAMNDRFKAEQEGAVLLEPLRAETDRARILQEIAQAGYQARVAGMRFSACGETLDPNGSANRLEQAGYGNSVELDCEFESEECPECHAEKVLTKVSKVKIGDMIKTRISGSCGCLKETVKSLA